jgi:hypothetical protein
MFCKYCGGEISSKDKFCIHCGRPIFLADEKEEEKILKTQAQNKKRFPWTKLIIAICIIGFFYTIFLIENENGEINRNIYVDYLGALNEMDPFLLPVGYFAEPSLFYSDNISDEEWLSFFKYTEPEFLNIPEPKNPRFPNQLGIYSSVVKIVCEDEYYVSSGSGINMDDPGFVITNAHILEGMKDAECLIGFPDPRTGLIREAYYAVPIINEKNQIEHDLILLVIEDIIIDEEYNVYGFHNKVLNLAFPSYQETDECLETAPSLGDQVFVLGYPDLSGGALTITDGLVSSLYSPDGYLITSAKISSGNSGGLALDSNGCFIGVPTAVYSSEKNGETIHENYGEIIDAVFVYDFYNQTLDYYFDEYLNNY